jgi:hypothetical protein
MRLDQQSPNPASSNPSMTRVIPPVVVTLSCAGYAALIGLVRKRMSVPLRSVTCMPRASKIA